MGKSFALALAAAALLTPSHAQAGGFTDVQRAEVRKATLTSTVVRVRVVARRGTVVRLKVKPRRHVRARTVRFGARRSRLVRLRLTRRGRRAVRTCSRPSVRVLARVHGFRGDVVRVPLRCAAPAPSGSGAGTDAGATPTPTPGPTAQPTSQPTAEPTPAPSPEPTPSPSPEPTPSPSPEPTPSPTPSPTPEPEPENPGTQIPTLQELLAMATGSLPGCDPMDPSACLLPFPNDHFTKADPGSETGRRVDLQLTAMPRNIAQKPIDPTEWNRSDGWSTGSPIITRVPGLDVKADLDASGIVQQRDMARAFDPEQPVVLIDAETGQRQLIWAELDHHPDIQPSQRTLIIRPGTNLATGRRYIVALRNLVRADGVELEPQGTFRLYRDGVTTLNSSIESRRAHMETVFADLEAAGIEREDLYLAWDFTTASTDDRTGRMLSIRDQAFEQLGDTDLDDLEVQGRAPAFEVATVENVTEDNMGRRIEGTFTVPCFMDKPQCPPAANRFLLDADGNPTQLPGNTMSANFICNVPKRALAGEAVKPSLYGHGLLGSAGEVTAGNVKAMAQEHAYMFCATDWAGMATTDVPTVATILPDLSNFPNLADRVQQGMLNFLYLGRLMIHADGFAGHEAFKAGDGTFIDRSHLYYDGNSQGGIIGQALVAVSPDVERAVLGVPGINYSTLLQRSVDFETDPASPCPAPPDQLLEDLLAGPDADPEYALELFNISYACPLYLSYPTREERQLLFALMQQLWDRAEGNGYAAFTRGGLPDTPPHEVLLHAALADHQVAQIAAETQARTVGAAVRAVPFDEGRSLHAEPVYGAERITSWPYKGSAIEIWDSGPPRLDTGEPADCAQAQRGTGLAPLENLPPTCGRDPHSEPRSTVLARRQKAAFLQPPAASEVIDVCNAGPCHSRNWKGSF